MDPLALIMPRRARRAATLDAYARRFDLRATPPATRAERKAARTTWRRFPGSFVSPVPPSSVDGCTELSFEAQRGAPRDDGARRRLRTAFHPDELAYRARSAGNLLSGIVAGRKVTLRPMSALRFAPSRDHLLWIEMQTVLQRVTLHVAHPAAAASYRIWHEVPPTLLGDASLDAACTLRTMWPSHLETARSALTALLEKVVDLPAWGPAATLLAGDGRLGLLTEARELPDAERAAEILACMAALAAALDASPELPMPPTGPVRYRGNRAYENAPEHPRAP